MSADEIIARAICNRRKPKPYQGDAYDNLKTWADAKAEGAVEDLLDCHLDAAAVLAAIDAAGYAIVPKLEMKLRGGPELNQIRAMSPGVAFSADDIRGEDRKAVYNVMAYAHRKGELQKLGRGRYLRIAVETAGTRSP